MALEVNIYKFYTPTKNLITTKDLKIKDLRPNHFFPKVKSSAGFLLRVGEKSTMETSSKNATDVGEAMDVGEVMDVGEATCNMELESQNQEMSAADLEPDELHVYFMCDTTTSMGGYLASFTDTIIKIMALIHILLPKKARFAVVSYKDYCDKKEICTFVPLGSSLDTIVAFVKALRATGGKDMPEAIKTGLNKIADMIRVNSNPRSKSLVMIYTDAPPHWEGSKSYYDNKLYEKLALATKNPGYDWVNICKFFSDSGVPVCTFIPKWKEKKSPNMMEYSRYRRYYDETFFIETKMMEYFIETKSMMIHLGHVVLLEDTDPYTVTKSTMGILMHVLGAGFDFNEDFTMVGCDVSSCANLAGFRRKDCDVSSCANLAGFRRKDQGEDINKCMPHLDLALNSGVSNETPKGGFFLKDVANHLTTTTFSFPAIGIRLNLKRVLDQFSTNKAFKDMVFKVFDELLFTSDGCHCLTYNPIFGKLWREVCRSRGDARLSKLTTKLSTFISEIKDSAKKKQMTDWLADSYRSHGEIADCVASADSYEEGQNKRGLCLVIHSSMAKELRSDPTMKEGLRSLARAPTQEGLVVAQKLMAGTILIDGDSFELPTYIGRYGDVIPLYLPLSLRPVHLFSCLPHLLCPGMKFRLRPSIMLAIVAFLSENQNLKEKAETFLLENKGNWLNLDDVKNTPELLSEETIKLLHRVPQFLTDKENKVYNTLFQVSTLRIALRKQFTVKMPAFPKLMDVLPDHRFQCVSCKHHRSFTLMTPGDRCGLCVYQYSNPEYQVVVADVPDPTRQSRLACCQDCFCIYEVVKHKQLRDTPRCHFCRAEKTAPFVTCSNCTNRYVSSDASLLEKMKQNGRWTCGICLNASHLSFEEKPFLLQHILFSNLHLMNIFNFVEEVFAVIYQKDSMFKIYTDSWKTMTKTPSKNKEAIPVKMRGRNVVEVMELTKDIARVVEEGDLTDTCNICYDDKSIQKLTTSACGSCTNVICFECQEIWAKKIMPGRLVLPTDLICFFCRLPPHESLFTKYNRPAKSLLHKEHLPKVLARMNPYMYYGWCQGCSTIQEICPVECGGADKMPFSDSNDFVCDGCDTNKIDPSKIPKCPGCKAPTTKAYGCNHMTCTVCKTHWCYACVQEFDQSTIYDHLRQVHGGLGIEN